jgi:hypothetical protein
MESSGCRAVIELRLAWLSKEGGSVKVGTASGVTETQEGLGLALGLLEGARRDILRAKHVLRSVGANENLTIHSVESLVRDMDTYVLPIVRDWKSCEGKAKSEEA